MHKVASSMSDSCFVTHLECSMTGERHEAGRLHNLSRAGKPLLVRYDLAAVARALPLLLSSVVAAARASSGKTVCSIFPSGSLC